MNVRSIVAAILLASLAPTLLSAQDRQDSTSSASVEARADLLRDIVEQLPNPREVSALTIQPRGRARPDLSVLEKLPGLRKLILARVAIDNDDLRFVCELTALESLDLSGTLITNQGVADYLPQLRKLRELKLDSTRISNACLPDLGKLVELRHLSLRSTKIDSPTLRKLDRYETLEALEQLDQLETLGLDGVSLVDTDLLHLAKLGSLRHVYVGHHISINGLYALKASAPSIIIGPQVLQRLSARVVPDDEGEIVAVGEVYNKELERLITVEPMRSVRSLSLLQAPTANIAAGFPGVSRLTLEHAKLNATHIPILAGWKSLKELHLQECSVTWTAAEAKALGRLSIKGLELDSNP